VVLLDIGLPRLNGYEVAKRLRHDLKCDCLLVAVTGFANEEYRQQAFASGFDHFFAKPADLDALQALLSTVASPEVVL